MKGTNPLYTLSHYYLKPTAPWCIIEKQYQNCSFYSIFNYELFKQGPTDTSDIDKSQFEQQRWLSKETLHINWSSVETQGLEAWETYKIYLKRQHIQAKECHCMLFNVVFITVWHIMGVTVLLWFACNHSEVKGRVTIRNTLKIFFSQIQKLHGNSYSTTDKYHWWNITM